MAEQRVVIEVDFRIERQHIALLGKKQRIDFRQRGILIDKELEELSHKMDALADAFGRQSKKVGNLPGRISRKFLFFHMNPKKRVRSFLRKRFDIHSA